MASVVSRRSTENTQRYFIASMALHAVVISMFSVLMIENIPAVIPPPSHSVKVMLSNVTTRCPVLAKLTPIQQSSSGSTVDSSQPMRPQAVLPETQLHASVLPVATGHEPSQESQIPTPQPVAQASSLAQTLSQIPSTSNPSPVVSTKMPLVLAAVEAPVSEARYNAAYLNNPKPNYPKISKRLGEVGVVILKVRVMADGTAGHVSILNSSNFERLDQSALEAVRQWRFVAAKKGETPIESWVSIPITFKLES